MRNVSLAVGLNIICVVVLNSIVVLAGEPMAHEKNQKALADVVQRLSAIKDVADVSASERQQILMDIGDGVLSAQSAETAQLNEYVRQLLVCVDWLTSCEFGDRQTQDTLSQRIVLGCLPLADAIALDLEFRLVSQLRLGPGRHLDASGRNVTGKGWQLLRNRQMEHRLHLMLRISGSIDPRWDPNDVPMMNVPVPGSSGYGAGVAPEAIKELPIRKQYKAALEANHRKAEKHREQRSARDMRDRYLPRLREAIADAYSMGPVTADDLDVLKAYLRIYVSDEKLRMELFDAAKGAVKPGRSTTSSAKPAK